MLDEPKTFAVTDQLVSEFGELNVAHQAASDRSGALGKHFRCSVSEAFRAHRTWFDCCGEEIGGRRALRPPRAT